MLKEGRIPSKCNLWYVERAKQFDANILDLLKKNCAVLHREISLDQDSDSEMEEECNEQEIVQDQESDLEAEHEGNGDQHAATGTEDEEGYYQQSDEMTEDESDDDKLDYQAYAYYQAFVCCKATKTEKQ